MMIQNAILRFQKSDGTESCIKVSQGENVGTHLYTKNNDYNCSDTGKDYLLAPFNCIVRAIRKSDNQVLFENQEGVQIMTPSGLHDHFCFTVTHMNDVDFDSLYINIGRRFKQGERIYREGTKGLASGAHIHMSQALGAFKGGIASPTKKMMKLYKYNGKYYYQYQINADNEVSATDAFFVGSPVEKGISTTANNYVWKKVPLDHGSGQVKDVEVTTMKMKLTKSTISPNRYPTRPTYNGVYDKKTYFLNVGDVVTICDLRADKKGNVVCQISNVETNDVSTSVLNGRWFVYDKNYFLMK